MLSPRCILAECERSVLTDAVLPTRGRRHAKGLRNMEEPASTEASLDGSGHTFPSKLADKAQHQHHQPRATRHTSKLPRGPDFKKRPQPLEPDAALRSPPG